MHSQINFGYPWAINYGHLILATPFLALFCLGLIFRWRKPIMAVLGLVALWALAAFVLVRFGFDMNGRAPLPTQAFLRSGTGKVLDMGAGTGRSTLMVLEARPQATVVALDSFTDSYVAHFGDQGTGPVADQGRARLLANMRAAGVDRRVSVVAGDMRSMPLPSGSFDAAVSAFAIDHLNSQGIHDALGEARRVLKPGGDLLLIVVHKDFWLDVTFGPLMMHSRMVLSNPWDRALRDAGFEIVERGTPPATQYVLARKP
jgi:ubiquinone/menaquinone biosynthesis C-methylase UbiE